MPILKDKLPGGLGDSKDLNKYCPEQLLKGLLVELEHTDDPAVSMEIVTDHLEEDSKYYDKLEEMERTAQDLGMNLETGEGIGDYVEEQILQFAPPEVVEQLKQKYLEEGRTLEDLSMDEVIDLLDDLLDMPVEGSYKGNMKMKLSNEALQRIANSVPKAAQASMTKNWELFEQIEEVLGTEELLMNIAKGMNGPDFNDALEYIAQMYDLNSEEEEV